MAEFPLTATGSQVSAPARVAETLLERIRRGEYSVGSQIPSERQLALDFNVSRPVIREALQMLAMLEVVESLVGRGTFVTAMPDFESSSVLGADVATLADVIDVREVIETGALRLAAQRARPETQSRVRDALDALRRAVSAGDPTADLDRRLHRELIAASGSPTLLRLWMSLEAEIARSIRVSPHGRHMSAELLVQHEQLAASVLSDGLDDALEASRSLHIDNRAFLRSLEQTQVSEQ